jgi:hypothetical protein
LGIAMAPTHAPSVELALELALAIGFSPLGQHKA